MLAGKYRVERTLGVGGMGVVVAAHHIHLDERVAIKFLLPEVAVQGGEPVARFMREGRAAAKIRSEHVARVSDVGALEDGTPFLVMEYLEGRDLSQVLDEGGPLTADDALDYVLQACEALAEAHALGIVHRDLKPANLFLASRADGSPCVKVLDFGISKMRDKEGFRGDMTRTKATLGSPLYMSPEQLVSTGDVDARADLWSIGVILFELLSGKLPYEAETMPQLVAQVLQNAPRRLRSLVPGISEGLDEAVMRCLQPATMRYQNIGEMAEAFAPFAPARSQISIQRVSRLFGGAPGAGTQRLSRPSSFPDVSPHAKTVSASDPRQEVALPVSPRALAQSGSLSVSTNRVVAGGPRRAVGLVAIGVVALLVVAAGGWMLLAPHAAAPEAASASPSGPPALPPLPPVDSPATPSTELAVAPPPSVASTPPSSIAAPPRPSAAGARPRSAPGRAAPAATKPLPIPGDRQ
jgi:serine/threonine-protein kinase